MDKAEQRAKAIRAAMAYTGTTQEELAQGLGIRPETLSRKLRNRARFWQEELDKADDLIGWKFFMKEGLKKA